jgi:thymidylate synthase
MTPGALVMSFGDVHLYKNHVKAAQEQILRRGYVMPTLVIDAPPEVGIFDLLPHHIRIENYQSHDPIKAEVSK